MPVSARVVRATLACAVIALLPVQLLAFAGQPVEPYPALTQPGFLGAGPLHDGILRREVVTITAITSTGAAVVIDPDDLVPNTGGIDERAIIIGTFRDPAAETRPDLAEWMRSRLAILLPHDQVSTVTVRSERVLNPVASPERLRVDAVLWQTTIIVGENR